MSKQISRWLDPILLIGLFISIAVSVGMVLAGNDTVSGLTIGLLSTIVTLLIDIVARIQKAEDTFVSAVSLSQLFSNSAVGEALQDIARSYELIEKFKFEHYCKIAMSSVEGSKSKLREIASGSVTVVARTPLAYVVLGFQQASKSIKVIHLGSMDFWSKDSGRNYFELNRAAIKRGVQVTRIFALTSEDARSNVKVLKEHEKAGVQVFVVRPDRVDHTFMIFDDRILIDTDIDMRNDVSFDRLVLEPAQVEGRMVEFEYLITYHARTMQDIVNTLPEK